MCCNCNVGNGNICFFYCSCVVQNWSGNFTDFVDIYVSVIVLISVLQLIWSYKRNLTVDMRFDSVVADVCGTTLQKVTHAVAY